MRLGMWRLAALAPSRCLASTWSPSRSVSTSDASLVRALLRRLHPDRVHDDSDARAANTAAYVAVSSWADDPHGDNNHSHRHTVRVTAHFREGDGLRRVDAALPPRGASPPRVALAPLLEAAGLVDQDRSASPSHTTESAAELAAVLATRDAASFLSRAHALAAARRRRAASPPPPTAEAAAIRAVHGVRLAFGPGLMAPGARGGATARAVTALAGVPPGTLRGARLTLTDADGVSSHMNEHGIWLALHDGDAVWAGVIASAASPTDEEGTTAWRAAADAAAALRSCEDAAAAALGVGAVAVARGVGEGGRYGELLRALAEAPPPTHATPRVAVRFVASTACNSPPPAGVIEVAVDATPSEVAATVAARAPAAAAAAADADRAAAAADALLTEFKARLGAEADVVAAPGACPAAVARAAADLLRSAPALRRELGGAWGPAVIRVGGAAHAISEDGREVVVGV